VMLITRGGQIIRSPVKGVRVAGRNTQGVKLINLDMGDLITAVARVVPDDKDEGEAGDEGDDASPDGQLELTSED
jgi:DNA gyrase subunit A